MVAQYTYSYFRVSKTDDVQTSARKYRDLRLQALKVSPESFSSTYEIESAFTEEEWISRLTVENREVFICSAQPLDGSATEWIAQVTVCGPMSEADFTLPIESEQPAQKSDEEEERWQMLSLFALLSHRGNGLGGKLCQEALNYLRTLRSSPPGVQVRLIVKAGNDITINLYKRLGFVDAGRATLAEALIANGDSHLLPEDISIPKFSNRFGIIMLIRLTR
ncbi:hypothetical protein N7495_005680 [Penicillium taxi]|uniref:uncharacterized protein n=1 Tax=Penicillium taxi TaxID=168475 RepID=UPI002545A806|nr:uncharacterized protein N7495_005680 [Penicillium taxi]KAJ5893989.1 hypothetical protein N7495_005680 [Penicillium taxi]